MRKLSRKKAHRDHMLRNLLASLVLYEQIDTTEAKAKMVKSSFDEVIARNKSGDLAAIRAIHQVFFDQNAAKKVIKELLPRYISRSSGFVKSFHLKNRQGDNAPMMRLELVDKKTFVDELKPAHETKENEIVKSKAEKDENK